MQRINAAFRDFVREQCCVRLEHTGLTRHAKRGGSLFAPINDTFQYWVGLNLGLYLTRVSLTPVFGVHIPPLEKLIAEIRQTINPKNKYKNDIATYALAHTQLIKPPPRVDFTPAGDMDESLERLAELSTRVGLPFAKSIASYEALLPRLMERVSMLGGNPERVAGCLFLMGRAQDGLNFLQDFAETRPDKDRWIPFVEAFTRRISD